jgi:transcriptional regulator with XRE-family HTH domain
MVRAARKAAGLSIHQAAKRLSISPDYLEKQEREGFRSLRVAMMAARLTHRCDPYLLLMGDRRLVQSRTRRGGEEGDKASSPDKAEVPLLETTEG